MDVRHPQACHHAAFVGQGVVRSRKSEIDDCREASLADQFKLRPGGLSGGAEPVTDRAEIVNF